MVTRKAPQYDITVYTATDVQPTADNYIPTDYQKTNGRILIYFALRKTTAEQGYYKNINAYGNQNNI